MDQLIEVVDKFGPFLGIVFFFIWRDQLREERREKQLEEAHNFIQGKLITLIEENTEALTNATKQSSTTPDGAMRMAGGGGGGGAGINTSNVTNLASGWGGASAGARTSRTLGISGAAVANTLPFSKPELGHDGPAIIGSTSLHDFGGGGGAGGGNAQSYASVFQGSSAGALGGLYGGGGGGGAGIVNGNNQSNEGWSGGAGIAVIITTFN